MPVVTQPSRFLASLALVSVGLGAACTIPSESSGEHDLTAAVRRERATLIRDSAAEMGMYNAALLGGIAISETNLAHCYSEAPYACPGPDSPSCGGPIIAGGADGPCSAMQGGLGMFQFDAGTYAQTVATYGDSILTVEGNTAQAVNFVVDRLKLDITGVHDWLSATDYLNQVPLKAGDPVTEEWSHFLACRYNGCCSASALCTTRANGYRDNAIAIFNEFGADFWHTAARCAAIPADGVIDQRSECYVAGGDPRYWRHEATGYGDSSEWTNSTASTAPANFAQWRLAPATPATYHLEVYVAGGAATKATYQVVHAGTTEPVVIDQTTAAGWVALGDFALAADGNDYVQLGDNTGTAQQRLVFDALRATSLDGPGEPSGGGGNGGCATGGGGTAGTAGMLGLAALVARRRRGLR